VACIIHNTNLKFAINSLIERYSQQREKRQDVMGNLDIAAVGVAS